MLLSDREATTKKKQKQKQKTKTKPKNLEGSLMGLDIMQASESLVPMRAISARHLNNYVKLSEKKFWSNFLKSSTSRTKSDQRSSMPSSDCNAILFRNNKISIALLPLLSPPLTSPTLPSPPRYFSSCLLTARVSSTRVSMGLTVKR